MDSPRRRRRRIEQPKKSKAGAVVGVSLGVGIALIAIVLGGLYLSRPRVSEPRLIGTWRSDAEASIVRRRETKSVTESQEAALRKLLGRMKVTYTADTSTTDFADKVETRPYKVLRKDGNLVVIQSRMKNFQTGLEQEVDLRIEFVDDDTYWVYEPQFDFHECFRRVK